MYIHNMDSKARIFRSGNSLAIRLPSVIAKHYALEDGTVVDIAAGKSGIHITKAPPEHELVDLLDEITPENLHAEHFSDLVGNERW